MLNKVNLIGNLGKDPEIMQGCEGVKFSIATTEKWKDKNGEKQEKTQWHNVVAFGELKKNLITTYLQKGSKVFIEGSIEYNKKETDGEVKHYTSIKMEKIVFLDKKGEISEGKQQFGSTSEEPMDDDDIPF